MLGWKGRFPYTNSSINADSTFAAEMSPLSALVRKDANSCSPSASLAMAEELKNKSIAEYAASSHSLSRRGPAKDVKVLPLGDDDGVCCSKKKLTVLEKTAEQGFRAFSRFRLAKQGCSHELHATRLILGIKNS